MNGEYISNETKSFYNYRSLNANEKNKENGQIRCLHTSSVYAEAKESENRHFVISRN